MPSPSKTVSTDVFLNIPYDDDEVSESLLIAYTAGLVALGRKPRLTFEIPDRGRGRMKKIFDLLQACPVSIHDLSAVKLPVRFNMPFELGLACAIQELRGENEHEYHIFDAEPHRLKRHLTDLQGIDPKIHGSTPKGIITSILDLLDKPGGAPPAIEVMKIYDAIKEFVPVLKDKHQRENLRGRQIFGELVALGLMLC